MIGQRCVLTKAVKRHSTSARVETTSRGTHRCSLVHTKLVQTGFCSRRSNVVKKEAETLHCFVHLLLLQVSHSWAPRHSSPRLHTSTVNVEVFSYIPGSFFFFIKVNYCRSSDASLLCVLSSPYLSLICLCLKDVQLLTT